MYFSNKIIIHYVFAPDLIILDYWKISLASSIGMYMMKRPYACQKRSISIKSDLYTSFQRSNVIFEEGYIYRSLLIQVGLFCYS